MDKPLQVLTKHNEEENDYLPNEGTQSKENNFDIQYFYMNISTCFEVDHS
jgi:hypothetical protein